MGIRISAKATLLAAAASLLLLSACSTGEEGDHAKACTAAGGKWVAEAAECEIDNKQWCEARGGKFNQCASACRNAPGPQPCILICVPVCAMAGGK
ncbi:MAG: hypothetical protein AAF942_08045 [Pseudomonadota bacterium]